MRHEYVLFPFLMVSPALWLDDLGRLLPARRARLALGAGALAISAVTTADAFRRPRFEVFSSEAMFTVEGRELFATGGPYYTTEFGFVGLYGAWRGLGWRYEESVAEGLDRFAVANREHVYFERLEWVVGEPPSRPFCERLAALLENTGEDQMTVFAARQPDPGTGPPAPAAHEEVAAAYAAAGIRLVESRAVGLARIDRVTPAR
jgi:hypothetical protein